MGKGMGPKGKASKRIVDQGEVGQVENEKNEIKGEKNENQAVSGLPTKRSKQK